MRMPQSSAMRASAGAFRLAWSQPMRIFSVTGTGTARTVASRMRAAATFVAHQRAACHLADRDLLHRAAEVDVDDVRTARDRDARRLGHRRRIAAGKLERGRRALERRHAQRVAVLAHHRPGRDHLRDDQSRAESAREPPERQVGHARHRREDDRGVDRTPPPRSIGAREVGAALFGCGPNGAGDDGPDGGPARCSICCSAFGQPSLSHGPAQCAHGRRLQGGSHGTSG